MTDSDEGNRGEARWSQRCDHCTDKPNIVKLPMTHLDPGVEYWRCMDCGRVWGTVNGQRVHASP